MLFATEKARDAFEKWAMFKKRRASMSDTAVDVAKLSKQGTFVLTRENSLSSPVQRSVHMPRALLIGVFCT